MLQKYGNLIAAVWGLAEATVFFLVPDILLTFLCLKSFRKALWASVFCLVGALVGGTIMLGLTGTEERAMLDLLIMIPGIDQALVEKVYDLVQQNGIVAVLWAPLQGLPYKVCAVQWARLEGEWIPFLLISVPARMIRFIFSILITFAFRWACDRFRWYSWSIGSRILLSFWVLFYVFYFAVI